VSVTIFNAKAETRVQAQLSVKGQAVTHSHSTVYVLINVYTVAPDLRPINEKDPRGSRMIQWKSLKPVCCGIVNMSFPLSDQPVFGEWFIFVEVQGQTYNKSFEVQKYVMPKFELVIVPPPYIRDLSLCEQASVTARYTFGKPVTGKLTVNMTVNGVGYYRHEMGQPVIKTMEIKGSANFSLCVKDMMPLDVADHFRGTVSIWASVTSIDGSRQTTFDDSTAVHKQLIDIKYSKETRKQFKPGLPYKGKIEVTYPDGSPADGVRVRVKAELTPKDNIYTSELISKGGEATFEIPSIPIAAQYVWLEVFKEMADFDVSDVFGVPKDDGHVWWPGLSSKRRRRSSVFPWQWDITKDARFAFTVRKCRNRVGGDDRYGELKPSAERRDVH
uniref:Macroglobulin domain-containing protein n=1 Tax=Poecilia latipinna TaxID=48699 RepID=A0A3B3VA99_9TELE